MNFERNVGRKISFSSDESGQVICISLSKYALKDPSLKTIIPKYMIIKNFGKITGDNSEDWVKGINAIRRGLLLMRTLGNLSDLGTLEWVPILKMIKNGLDILQSHTKEKINSCSHWENISKYVKRSRRFVTWVKVAKCLSLLANEFPEIEPTIAPVYDKVTQLLRGDTRLAVQNPTKWEEEMKTIPRDPK
jgi:hypothetical protein